MIFIPTPNKDESHGDFIDRCIPIVINEGTAKDGKQGRAICESIWKKEKKKNVKNKRKVLFHLSTKLATMNPRKENFEEGDLDAYDTVMIVGDGTYNGVYFPKEELEKTTRTFEGKPININHNDDTIEDIVGYLKNVRYDNGKLRATTFFDKNTVKYDSVNGYIKSRIEAGDVPNVSIGVWLELEEEELDDETTRLTARNLEGDHLAVVVHGACNPEDGCGIGMTDLSQMGSYMYKSPNAFEFIGDKRGYTIHIDDKEFDDILVDIGKEKDDLKKNIYRELIKKERLKHD